jgi:zinc protease
MIRPRLIYLHRILAAAMVVGGFLPAFAQAADIKPTRVVTANGITLLIQDQPFLPIITVNVLIRAGAVNDPDAKTGLAYLTAGMLDEGTKTRSATKIARELEFMGAEFTAKAANDFATATLRVLKKDADHGFTLLADILMNPAFAENEVARVRSELLGELQGEKDDPGTIAGKAFDEIVFKGHPYRRPTNGDEKTVVRITRQDLVAFHDKYYRPNQTIIAIVGDIREHEALDLVKKHFGKWAPQDSASPSFPAATPLQKPVLKLIDKDLTQATVVLGHVGIARRNPDFYAVAVMNYILGGGGFSSRLVNRIRDEQGLAYDVDSGFEADVMPGPFSVRLQTRNEVANKAIANVLTEITRIRAEPVSDQELADAKAYLIGSFPLRLDTTGKLAGLLTIVELHGLGLSYFEDYPKAIAAVTKEDVLRVAQKYLNPDLYALVVVAKQAEAHIDTAGFFFSPP